MVVGVEDVPDLDLSLDSEALTAREGAVGAVRVAVTGSRAEHVPPPGVAAFHTVTISAKQERRHLKC